MIAGDTGNGAVTEPIPKHLTQSSCPGDRTPAPQIIDNLLVYRYIEAVEGPSEASLIGNEDEVAEQLKAYARAGGTDFLASVFPSGNDEEASLARSHDLLKSLVGKL